MNVKQMSNSELIELLKDTNPSAYENVMQAVRHCVLSKAGDQPLELLACIAPTMTGYEIANVFEPKNQAPVTYKKERVTIKSFIQKTLSESGPMKISDLKKKVIAECHTTTGTISVIVCKLLAQGKIQRLSKGVYTHV